MGTDATNNIAEALACLIGILMALRLGAMSLGIGLDSMLLVHWLLGTSRCQDPILRRIVAQSLLALGGIPLWRVWHVYRRHNKRSDFMANYAMDQLASWATSLSLDLPPDFQVLIRGSARLDHRVRWWLEGRGGAARDEKENSVKKLYNDLLRRSQGQALRRRPIRPYYALARLTPRALRPSVDWRGFWALLSSKYCTAPVRDTLWRLFHGGLYTADRLAHIDPQHSRICCCCVDKVETRGHFIDDCSFHKLVWNKVAWLGRGWLEELWGLLPPTEAAWGWYRPNLRGAAFLATHAFVLPAGDCPPIAGSCLLQLLFVYTAHTLSRARVDELHHWRTRPPFPILVRRVRVQVIGVLRYTWATRPEAAFQPPHLPPQLAEVLDLE